MNKIKFIYISLIFVLIGLLSQSCDLEETNIDPANPTEATLDLILPGALAQSAFNQSAAAARISGIVMQQFLGFDAQQIEYSDYLIGTDALDNLWVFGLYAGSMKSANQLIAVGEADGNLHYAALGKIIMAHELGFATSLWGNIPYSEAFQRSANIAPSYDSQEEIMDVAINLLDEAISELNAEDPSGFVPGSEDFIYGGDVEKWVKFAHGLKARFLMMEQKRGASMDAILSEVAQSFESADDEAVFPWESALANGNPLSKFGIDRSGTLRGDIRFYNRLTAKGDPRLDFYYDATISEGDTVLNPFARGQGLTYAELDSRIPMMSYSELKFIEAEALARNGAGADEVSAALEEAIASNIAFVTGAADQEYAASRADLTDLDGDAIIGRIINEAYDAYYGMAFHQSWNNYRRTGYPAIESNIPANANNGFNPSAVVPRRYLYPENERITNEANLDAAISAQGGHLLDNDIWLFE